jgi:hypothetical protein
MKRKNIIITVIIVAGILLIAGGYIFIKLYTPKYNWYENLHKNNKQPYGTNILYELLKESTGKKRFIELNNSNLDIILKDKMNASYIFIGTNNFLDSLEVLKLINFAEKGNKVFISSTVQFDSFLSPWIYDSTIYPVDDYFTSDSMETKLYLANNSRDSIFSFYYQVLKKTGSYTWRYFTDSFLDYVDTNYSLTVLATIDGDYPSFIKIRIDSGAVYLHTNPIVFSNYHISRDEAFNYIQPVLNEISAETIIWDNYSNSPYHNLSDDTFKESPLKVMLKNKSFRWAWYTLLISVIIFIIVQSKRKQNVIQLMEKKDNNTLDYMRAIGSLYFQSSNHHAIIDEMMNQLFSYIRLRYNIKVGKNKDEIIEPLSKASGIDEKILKEMFTLNWELMLIEKIDSEDLYKLYQLVNHFYTKSN